MRRARVQGTATLRPRGRAQLELEFKSLERSLQMCFVVERLEMPATKITFLCVISEFGHRCVGDLELVGEKRARS